MDFRLNNLIIQLLLMSSLLCTPLIGLCDTEDADAYRYKLGELRKSIDKIQQHLKGTKSKRGNIITELRQLESKISKNALQLASAEKQIKKLDQHIGDLKKELGNLKARLKQQRTALAEQMRSAYMLGAQQHLKVILSQQNPAEFGRQQIYYSYLTEAREAQILDFLGSIETSQKMEEDLNQSLETQKKALEKSQSQKNELQKQRQKRNELLVELNSKIKNQEQTLFELEASRGKIENLLMSLGELLADVPAAPNDKNPFSNQKGRLPWPVTGQFLAKFGQDRDRGGLKWNGVLIKAPYGTPVKAISHGRVAFADWLQGFGFITILDHGDGYMSLYGHSETLFKQAGDWVNAGEEIATTGDSGGQAVSGLYFEIRSKGKPVNPNSWCSLNARHSLLPDFLREQPPGTSSYFAALMD